MIHGIGLSGLASILVLGILLQSGAPPRTGDPHADPDASVASGGCEDLVAYVETLFETLDEHPTFGEFWFAPDYDGIQQMERSDVEAIVDDGRALIDDMEAMAVPEPYLPGHEGIQLIFGADVDYVVFLGIDASSPPTPDERDHAFARLLQGELTVANACPDELEEVGGYIFFNPVDIESYFD